MRRGESHTDPPRRLRYAVVAARHAPPRPTVFVVAMPSHDRHHIHARFERAWQTSAYDARVYASARACAIRYVAASIKSRCYARYVLFDAVDVTCCRAFVERVAAGVKIWLCAHAATVGGEQYI